MFAGCQLVWLWSCWLSAILPLHRLPRSNPDPAAASAPASQPLALIKGPYLQAMRPDGLVICLEPSQESVGRLVVQDASGKRRIGVITRIHQ